MLIVIIVMICMTSLKKQMNLILDFVLNVDLKWQIQIHLMLPNLYRIK